MTSSSERRLPDFFIVGHPKSGTTALYEMLRAHPQVFMPDVKEPRFFATDLRSRFQPRDASPGLELPRTLDEYLDLFAAAAPGQVLGEASPSYLRSAVAAGLISQARPDARIIAVLREPASFLRSLHLEMLQNHVESERDLRLALEHEQVAGPEELPRYSDRVRYVEQLRRYHAAFPREQVLVLIYDDFRADNEGTLRRVLRFLDLDADVPLRVVEANPSIEVRSLRADRFVRRLYAADGRLARSAKGAVRSLVPSGRGSEALRELRRRLLYASPAAPEQELMAELRARFRPEVQALSEYLDRDLVALWGYDGAG
jgi:hypothetical protein